MILRRGHWLIILASISASLISPGVADELNNKTVIGPTSPLAAEGLAALQNGDATRALPLLKKSMNQITGERNFVITLSNICAAYVLLEQYADAVSYCGKALEMRPNFWRALNNRALAYIGAANYRLAKADIDAGLALSPNATSLNKTLRHYNDIVNPVVPVIVIDDSRLEDIAPQR